MDNNLTINSLAFGYNYSEKSGSKRTNITRGVNLPTIMQVKHQAFIDSLTKRAGRQSALMFDYHMALADGTIVPAIRWLLKCQLLTDVNVTDSLINSTRELVVGTIQEDDSGLDLGDEIFVNQEQ